MKKNRIQKITAQVKRNTKNAEKAKKRIKSRIKHTPLYVLEQESKNKKFKKFMNCKPNPVHILSWEPGPSKSILYDKDGKVFGFLKWDHKKKQSEYTTEIAKAAMEENKKVKNSKKELIKSILQKAGYDPTIKYTRKEKKKFTRIVKNKLFTKSAPVMTTEQIKEKLKIKKLTNKELKAKFDESVRNNPLPPKAGKQRAPSAAELSVKEKPNKRNFQYSINRKCSDNEMRTYAFTNGNFDASTRDEALKKAKELFKKYEKENSFTGVTIKDIEGDNSITYYGRAKLLAA